jgi:hypothetical protein
MGNYENENEKQRSEAKETGRLGNQETWRFKAVPAPVSPSLLVFFFRPISVTLAKCIQMYTTIFGHRCVGCL